MKTSDTLADLAAALAAAQGEIENAVADAKNPHFGSSYADLRSIRAVIQKPFAKHGLSVIQFPCSRDDRTMLATRIMHKSGQWIEDECELLIEKTTMQGLGSAITYMKRYALAAVCGVAEADDDGNEAEKSPKSAWKSKQPLPKAQKTDLPKPNAGPADSVNTSSTITAERRIELWNRIKNDLKMDEQHAKNYVATLTGKVSSKDLTYADYQKIMFDIDDKILGMKNIPTQTSWEDEVMK